MDPTEGLANAVLDHHWGGQEINIFTSAVVFLATSEWPQHLVPFCPVTKLSYVTE